MHCQSRQHTQYDDWATGWVIHCDPRHGQQIFLLYKTSKPVLGPFQHLIQYHGSLPGLMQAVHEVDHPHSSSAQIKNKQSYTSVLLYAIMAQTGTTLPFSFLVNAFVERLPARQ